MGILDVLTGQAGRDLDRNVVGAHGSAHARFTTLDDDTDLTVEAAIGGENGGTLALRVRPQDADQDRQETGAGSLTVNLGRGKRYRGSTLTVESEVAPVLSGSLAVLTVRLSHPPSSGARPDSYSVESRFPPDGHAHLTLVIQLG